MDSLLPLVLHTIVELGGEVIIIDEVYYELLKLKARAHTDKTVIGAVKALEVIDYSEKQAYRQMTQTPISRLKKNWQQMSCQSKFVDNIFKYHFDVEDNMVLVTDDKNLFTYMEEEKNMECYTAFQLIEKLKLLEFLGDNQSMDLLIKSFHNLINKESNYISSSKIEKKFEKFICNNIKYVLKKDKRNKTIVYCSLMDLRHIRNVINYAK